MRLSQDTIDIISNFSQINKSIYFKAGQIQAVKTQDSSNVIAKATLEESFPKDFPIYNADRWIQSIAVFDKNDPPDISFEENHVVLKSGRKKVRWRFSDPSLVQNVPIQKLKTPPPFLTFEFPKSDYRALWEAYGSLKVEGVAIASAEGEVVVRLFSQEDPDSNSFVLHTGTKTDLEFRMLVNLKHLNMIDINYTAELIYDATRGKHGLGCVHFIGKEKPVEYWVTVQIGSRFGPVK